MKSIFILTQKFKEKGNAITRTLKSFGEKMIIPHSRNVSGIEVDEDNEKIVLFFDKNGVNSRVYTNSTDSWEDVPIGSNINLEAGFKKYIPELKKYVITYKNSDQKICIGHSSDAKNWEHVTVANFQNNIGYPNYFFYSKIFNSFFAYKSSKVIKTNGPDLTNWDTPKNFISNDNSSENYIFSIDDTKNNRFIIYTQDIKKILITNDGSTWTKHIGTSNKEGNVEPSFYDTNGIYWNQNLQKFYGADVSSNAAFWLSEDGIDWNVIKIQQNLNISRISYSSWMQPWNCFLGIAAQDVDNPKFVYSFDGIEWFDTDTNIPREFWRNFRYVPFKNSLYVFGGKYGDSQRCYITTTIQTD